jgi:tripartite-type tricarboxylate transporter receptor subunit TctC
MTPTALRSELRPEAAPAIEAPEGNANEPLKAAVGMITRRAALAAPWLFAPAAHAQDFPNRPLRIIVPFPPGGITDVLARSVAERMAESLGRPVVIENRPGATGQVGSQAVLAEPADGHAMILYNGGTHGILPALRRLPFDVAADFRGIGLIGLSPLALGVPDALAPRTLAEFLDYARARPGSLNFGSAGIGSAAHIMGALLAHAARLDLVHVPYQGLAPALAALAAGQVQILFDAAGVKALVDGGRARALATTGERRWSLLPDIPTFAEAGLPALTYESWAGLAVRAGTPEPVIARLGAALLGALAAEPTRRALAAIGYAPPAEGNTPAGLDRFAAAERARWSALVRETGMRLE